MIVINIFNKIFRNEKDKEYYDNLIAKVDKKLNPTEKIYYSLDVDKYSEILKKLEFWKEQHAHFSFQEDLLARIDERQMPTVEFYKKAHIDRKLFSAIQCNREYTPKKETAIKCCLALNLNEVETEELLGRAGFTLSKSKQRDVIIKHCINFKIYDIDDVNYLLNHWGEKSL